MSPSQSMKKESVLVSPFFLFFIIHSSQRGVGMLGFQSQIVKHAGYDAWIGIIIAGLTTHFALFIMFKLLERSHEGDIISLHREYLGKWIGNGLSVFLLLYFLMLSAYVFRNYIEILHVWTFSKISTLELSLVISVVIYYIVVGGFRVITGIVFLSSFVPFLLVVVLFFVLKYCHFSNLLPLMNHNIYAILKSSKESTISFLGFEVILLLFPFIKNNQKAKKWGHFGLMATSLLYVFLVIITFSYFSEGSIKYLLWPTLTMTRIVQLPFLERFELIFICSWLLVILAPLCLYIWSITRGLKLMFTIKPSFTLLGLLILLNIANIMLKENPEIRMLEKITSETGVYLLLAYLPLLYGYAVLKDSLMNVKK